MLARLCRESRIGRCREAILEGHPIRALSVAVQYLVNRNAELDLGYDYSSRDSSLAGQDYDKNVVGLSLILKM
jgi:hypothetical protein